MASLTHVPEIWRLLSSKAFDVVVLYGVPTNGWQTIAIARYFGVPVLFRAIDISHALRASVFRPLIKIAEKFIYKNADAISTHNEPLRQYCIENGAAPEKVSIEYPGLDLERFSPGPRDPELCSKYNLEAKDKTVLFMGTFFRFAGLDWFIDSFAPYLRSNLNFKLLLVGGGEAEQGLRTQVDRLGLSNNVIFCGFAEYPMLAKYLRLGDVAITTFEDSLVTNCALPGKVLQYLGCGLPTVCTPVKGLQSVICDENSGILYKERNHSFIEAVAALLANDEHRNELAKAARITTERLFQWDTCVNRFEDAIRKVVKNKSPKKQLV